MALDPQAQAYLKQVAAMAMPPMSALTPRQARMLMDVETRSLGEPPRVGRSEDFTIRGPAGAIRLRLTAPEGPGPCPALVYFHGGGWVVGSIATHDAVCRAITIAAGIAVISVDYRLAPEHPYPAAVEDAYAATEWVSLNGKSIGVDPTRIAVGGDSAGGNLAAAVTMMARDRGQAGPRIAYQTLLYPVTNADLDTPSYLEFAEGHLLTREAMAWYWDQYVPDPADRGDAAASPLNAADLGNLPPALVLTAEYDVLRDEGEAYAARLSEAGVRVRLSRYDGMIHGFVRRAALFDQGRKALDEIGATLRDALGPAS